MKTKILKIELYQELVDFLKLIRSSPNYYAGEGCKIDAGYLLKDLGELENLCQEKQEQK